MRTLISAVMACCVLCVGAKSCPPEASAKSPRLTEVVLYSQGETAGEVHVDLLGNQLRAIGPPSRCIAAGRSNMEICSVVLSVKEVAQLLKLVDGEALRRLSPEKNWFREPKERWDFTPAILLLRWDDRATSLFVASDLLKKSTPDPVKSAYQRIDAICSEMLALKKLHRDAGSSKVFSTEDDDPVVRKLLSDKNEAYRLAEPRGIWW